MTKKQTAELVAWLADVYRVSQVWADKLDPQRRHQNDTATKLDTITAAAKSAHFYLTETHPKEAGR